MKTILCVHGLEEGTPYPVQTDDRDDEYYLTEIARRFALTTNSVQSAIDSESGLSAMLIYKQGIINQGGPADIFLRRVLYEPTYDPIETDHPIVNVDIPITTTTTSDPITLPDENLFPADVYYDVDGYVYEDNDGDGSYNPGEGIAGVTLHLFIDVDSDGVVDLNIDLDGDGDMINEDIDGDGYQDVAEDLDGDGNLDVAEDTNSNGILDDGEDIDGDGFLDLYDEDIDGDGHLDVEEPDTNGDGIFDLVEYGDFSILTISDANGYYLFEDVPQDYAFAIAVVDAAYQAVNGRPTIVGELIVENPYAYENMECDEWAYTDGSNPNYLQGVCLSPAINLSGNYRSSPATAASGNDACAALFPMNDDGSNPTGSCSPRFMNGANAMATTEIEGCEAQRILAATLDDQSWENPYDVAKGHRGFLDGDIVMMMYAWSPNWNSNAVGNDHYNLYVRRSFDGGLTWTTTPAELGGDEVSNAVKIYGIRISHDGSPGTELPMSDLRPR